MKPLQLTKSMQSAKLNWRQILFAGLLIGSLFCSPVVTLFAGILFALTLGNPFPVWSKKASKKLLQYCVVGLGFGMNFHESLAAGREGMTFTVVSVVTVMIVGVVLGRLLRIDRKNSYLISSGTAICGGSAIAAVAPVIDAKDSDIAYALSATFLFDMAMIVLFPIMGRAMGLSDMAYGLWAGTAVNDTSSVVAAGYAFSEGAGDFATMVKLTRTLAIIPTVVVFSFVSMHLRKKEAAASGGAVQIRWRSVFPWFILGFLAMAVLSSVGVIPAAAAAALKKVSKFLMVTALAAVGLNTSFAEMKKSGAAPMVHGFLISALVVLVALAVEYFMGILPF